MKQIDIFGNEIDVNDIGPQQLEKQGGRITLRSYFRNCYGFKDSYYCKNCRYFKKTMRNKKDYFKCLKMGTGRTAATDIRKNDIACNLYEQKRS